MKIQDLLEARKNPELNPKISINAIAKLYVEKYGKHGFVSFTKVDKLGINPKSPYETPMGIYAYPIEYVYHEKIGDTHSAKKLPFAGNSPFATFFSASDNVIDLATFDRDDLVDAVSRLKKAYPTRTQAIDAAYETADEDAIVKTAGGIFWAFTLFFARSFQRNTPVIWNKIFRDIGVYGCVDSKGQGIIHANEPTQAVFFKKPGVIKNEKRIYNKYAPNEIARNVKDGKMIHQRVVDLANLRKTDIFAYIGRLENEERLHLLTQEDLDKLPLDKTLREIYGITPAYGDYDRITSIRKFTRGLRGKRWPACEALLATDYRRGVAYMMDLNKPFRLPALEHSIFEALRNTAEDISDVFEYALDYTTTAVGGRWKELEDLILTELAQIDQYCIVWYVKRVIKGPWPAAEKHLDGFNKRSYEQALAAF